MFYVILNESIKKTLLFQEMKHSPLFPLPESASMFVYSFTKSLPQLSISFSMQKAKKEKKTYQAHGFQSVIKFSVSRGKGKVGLDLLCHILFQGSCLASGVKTRFLPSNIMLINVMGEIVDPWACHMVGNNISHSALYKHAFLSSCRPS